MLSSLCSRRCEKTRHNAAWMIGTSLATVLVALSAKLVFGPTAYSEALLYSAFPIALFVSDACAGRRSDGPRLLRIIGLVLAACAMYAAFLMLIAFTGS